MTSYRKPFFAQLVIQKNASNLHKAFLKWWAWNGLKYEMPEIQIAFAINDVVDCNFILSCIYIFPFKIIELNCLNGEMRRKLLVMGVDVFPFWKAFFCLQVRVSRWLMMCMFCRKDERMSDEHKEAPRQTPLGMNHPPKYTSKYETAAMRMRMRWNGKMRIWIVLILCMMVDKFPAWMFHGMELHNIKYHHSRK